MNFLEPNSNFINHAAEQDNYDDDAYNKLL